MNLPGNMRPATAEEIKREGNRCWFCLDKRSHQNNLLLRSTVRGPGPGGEWELSHLRQLIGPVEVRLQGETDSFGAEYHYVCYACAREERAVVNTGHCDWCGAKEVTLSPMRDIDEGMGGPVYYVCDECRKRQDEAIQKELESYRIYDYDY